MSAFVNTPYCDIWDRYSKAPAGWEDHWYVHYYEIAVTADQIQNQLPVLIDTDADFYWRAIMGNQPEQFLLRFWDPWGNQLADNLDVQEQIAPNDQPGVFFPEVMCPRGSTVKVDIQEYTNANGTLKLALIGVKRYQAAA